MGLGNLPAMGSRVGSGEGQRSNGQARTPAATHEGSAAAGQAQRQARVAKAVHCPHCGCEIDDIDARSSKDHRRFFKIIHVAFHHWPEGHDFQPVNAEHLRAWLLCKADWKTVKTYQLPDTASISQMAAFMGLVENLMEYDESPRFGRWIGANLHVFKPKSIKFTKAKQKQFNKVRDAVSEIIEAEIGTPVETLLKGHEAAA